MTNTLSRSPILPDDDAGRREHSRLRLRLISGEWFDDLRGHMSQHFNALRERMVGKPDMSCNLFESTITSLSMLYSRPPTIVHADQGAADRISMLLADAGWQSLGARNQEYTLAMNESFIRPTLTPKGLLLRVVTPDMITAEADPDEPDVPVKITEARVRTINGEQDWYWDVFDIRDQFNPIHRIVRAKDGEDFTQAILGTTEYPNQYILKDGTPVLPYAIYHAKRTGKLFNWRDGVEAVEGTLTNAVLWSWWVHNVRDACWAQKWGMDIQPAGANSTGSGHASANTVVTDPSSVQLFRSDGDRASVGQWGPAVDPLTLGTSLAEFEQRLLVHFGLSPADLQQSSAGQSGYAISLKRSAVREAQRRFAPQFERGDQQLIRIISAITKGSPLEIPADGYTVNYPGLPQSIDEMQAEQNKHNILIEAGLESVVDSYMALHPGVSREVAVAALQRIKQENQLLG